MQFGDRILYNDGKSHSLGVFLKEISSSESLIKLDNKDVKLVLPTQEITFVKNMDEMDLAQAIAIADYISKADYDGHYTLLSFSTGYRFCFGTLDKINYNTTSLMPLGKTIAEAIKKAINDKVSADTILDKYDKMLR